LLRNLPTEELVVAGVRSAVYRAGPSASHETVVFVHGNPGPLDDWTAIASAVAKFCRVVAIDMPGFGRADHPRDFDFSVEGYARHLGGLLEQLDVGRTHLVLHDFGAPWGLCWAVDHPEQVASVTLFNSVLLARDFEWHTFAKIWQLPLLGELLQLVAGPAAIRAVMNRDNPRPLPRAFVERVLHYCDWNQKLGVLALYRSARDVAATFGPLGERVRALDLPACVIWGAEDRYTPVRLAERQRECFPRAEIHLLPGLGHWPFIEDEATTCRLVCEFLARQLACAEERAPSS